MKVKMCLFPDYIFYPSSVNSPAVVEFLEDEAVEIEEYRWDGTLDDVPTDELVIIRYSSRLTFSAYTLASFLSGKRLEHFVFYEDAVVLPNGAWSPSLLLSKLKEFLKKKMQEALKQPDPYKSLQQRQRRVLAKKISNDFVKDLKRRYRRESN